MRSLPSFSLIVAAFVLAQVHATHGQANYPNRAIQFVVTVPPGGAADNIARVIGAKLADALGQPVIINNRAGAGGTEVRPRWIHGAAEHDHDPRHRAASLSKPALRSGEGLRAGHSGCETAADHGAERGCPRAE